MVSAVDDHRAHLAREGEEGASDRLASSRLHGLLAKLHLKLPSVVRASSLEDPQEEDHVHREGNEIVVLGATLVGQGIEEHLLGETSHDVWAIGVDWSLDEMDISRGQEELNCLSKLLHRG